MKTNEIAIGNVRVIEHIIDETDVSQLQPRYDDPFEDELERLARHYYRESFVTLDNQTYSILDLGRPAPSTIRARVGDPTTYQVASELQSCVDGIVAQKRARGQMINSNLVIRVAGYDSHTSTFTIQPVRYDTYAGTNLGQDVDLGKFNPAFAGKTFREFDTIGGRLSPLHVAVMANMLGTAYAIVGEGRDGPAMLMTLKRGWHAVSAGQFGLPGGTPPWSDQTKPFAVFLAAYNADRIATKVLLQPQECFPHAIDFIHELERAPTAVIFYESEVPLSELAQRCSKYPDKFEHTRMYEVPLTLAGLARSMAHAGLPIMSTSRYALHRGAQIFMYNI